MYETIKRYAEITIGKVRTISFQKEQLQLPAEKGSTILAFALAVLECPPLRGFLRAQEEAKKTERRKGAAQLRKSRMQTTASGWMGAERGAGAGPKPRTQYACGQLPDRRR